MRWISLCCLIILLSACSAKETYAPVVNGWNNPNRSLYYVVQPGDTLYSIAWAFDMDYNDLVRINHLKSPYLIKTGARLKMAKALPKKPESGKAVEKAVYAKPASAKPTSSKPVPSKPAKRLPHKPQVQVAVKPAFQPAHRPLAAAYPQIPVSSWTWPTQGEIVRSYSHKTGGNRGLDIGGHLGQPILAAASGEVVYTGTGIRGYGLLIIIKHNQTYLSAYAHNQNILVKEGQRVKKGQPIATMGRTDGGEVMLHFEIRKSGKPVNPVSYLPKIT